MSGPGADTHSVTVPLPSDDDARAVIGEDYDPDTVPGPRPAGWHKSRAVR
jgi:hypothetical protein